MSLKGFLKAAGEVALGGLSTLTNQVTQYENEYDRWDDDELAREGSIMIDRSKRSTYGSASRAECVARFTAIANVLRSRGYDI